MSWIKYYTLTSTCLYLLSFNLAPVWCYLSRQTVFFFSLSLSASRAALRNVCLTEPPWLLGCCLDRIILLWTCEEILPSVWEIFRLADCIWGGGAVQGKRGLSRRFRTQIFHPASVYFSKTFRRTVWLLNIGALVNLDLLLFKSHHIVQLVPAVFFFMGRGIDTWRSLCAALYCKSMLYLCGPHQ